MADFSASDSSASAAPNGAPEGGARLPICAVIPAYNRGAKLERCLASIWAQRPAPPAEVIVVDDRSSDDTAEVAAALGARVIQHDENAGAATARNTAIHATSCEWVAFLDSDDEWLPDHLAHLWELRGAHALVASTVLECGSDPAHDRVHGPVTKRPVTLSSPDQIISTYNFFTASACMIRRDVAVELGGFHKWWGVEDFDLWVRVLERHSAICSPKVTVTYHVHDEQLSVQAERMQRGHRAVAEAHLERTGGSRVPLERWEGVAAWDQMRAALAAGERTPAVRHAAGLLKSVQRPIGLAVLLWTRIRLRRRSAKVNREGGASVAVLVADGPGRQSLTGGRGAESARDLSSAPLWRAVLSLIRRPAGTIVVGRQSQATLMRLVGLPAVTPDELHPTEPETVHSK